MNSKRAWWHCFSTTRGVNTTIVLFNAILIGIMWNTVFGLVRTERQDTIQAIDRNDNLAIAFEQYTVRTLQNADAVTHYLIREYVGPRRTIDLAQFMANYSVANNAIIGVVLADERGQAMTTESLIMEDVKGTIASLQAIRDLGVSIAIDDFGTGFSSLSYLAKLPVDALKIDRSFVIDMTTGPEGLALVSTIISLAHSLKLTVVAEGVETEEQSRLLRLLSCDEMQGFLFSKPVPAEIFERRFLAPPAVG